MGTWASEMRQDVPVITRGRRDAAPVIFLLLAAAIVLGGLATPAQAATTPSAHGTVTAADGSGPIGGITVCATRRTSTGGYGAQRCTETADDGTYTIQLTAGSYYSFSAEQKYLYGAWLSQDYNFRKAYVFNATTDRTISFALVRGASISGVITPPEGGPRIDNTHVSAHRVLSTGKVANTETSFSNVTPNGYFEVAKLPAGTYKLRVDDGSSTAGYRNQWYPAAAAASRGEGVTVTTGEAVTGRNITLTLSGALTITLRKPTGSLTTGQVQLYDEDGREIWQYTDGDPSTRTIPGLHPGVYKVRAMPLNIQGYQEWFTWKLSFPTANPITVTSGATTSKTLTFHYKTLKVTSRPKLTVETYRLTASKGTWTPQASRYQYDWVRDGKIFLRTELRDYYPQKADVGHRIKVCVTASRSGYASGRSCSDYSRTIKTY